MNVTVYIIATYMKHLHDHLQRYSTESPFALSDCFLSFTAMAKIKSTGLSLSQYAIRRKELISLVKQLRSIGYVYFCATSVSAFQYNFLV